MQVIGLCRFSYPAIGGFQVEHDSIEDRIAYLYAEERLEERFRLMETIALPCLRQQTDPDFDLVIVIGNTLPKTYQDRLRDLCADIPQIRIRMEPPRKQREVMKEILNQTRRDLSEPCLQFRHDDDDAVSVEFVERLRQTAEACSGLLKQRKSVAIDFNRGYIAKLGSDGVQATEVFRHYDVAALGMYVRGGSRLSIMNFSHQKIYQFMPTISISDTPMFIRSHNTYNDSRQKKVKQIETTPLSEELAEDFEIRFNIHQDHVRQVFGRG